MSRRIIIVIALIAGAMVAAGIVWDPAGFAESILAELAGTLISVLVAVLVVEKLIQRERRRQWDAIRNGLMTSASGLTEDFVYDAYGYFVSLPRGLIDTFGDGVELEPFGRADSLIRFVTARIDQLSGGNDREMPTVLIKRDLANHNIVRQESSSEGKTVIYVPDETAAEDLQTERHVALIGLTSSKDLYKLTQHLLRRLQEHLIPRAVQIAEDPPFIEKLTAAETAWREWRWSMTLVDHDWGFPEQGAWESYTKVARALDNLDQYVATVVPRSHEFLR